jgi:predicted extracellular nuclease
MTGRSRTLFHRVRIVVARLLDTALSRKLDQEITDAHTCRPSRRRTRAMAFLVAILLAVAAREPQALSSGVVISQVYGGGGNAGAALRNDFVELFNRGTSSVSLTGLSIQYASATGTGTFGSNPVTPLAGTLAPGQYYLVQLASGGANGSLLPAPDATGTVNMAATGGKVALVNGTAGLACNGGSTACSGAQLAQIIDLVGWDGANFYETAPAPATTAANAVGRLANGCTETDNNGADFVLVAPPTPRNTTSPSAPCLADTPPSLSSSVPSSGASGVALAANLSVTFSENVTVASTAFELSCGSVQPLTFTSGPKTYTLDPAATLPSNTLCTLTIHKAGVVDQDGEPNAMTADAAVTFTTIDACGDPATRIHTIQGNGDLSPLNGSVQTIEAIVTGAFQGAGQFGGYYVQEEDADGDGDPSTSEGIFVFNTAAGLVSTGDKIRVRGTVFEFTSSGTQLTELTSVTGVQSCSTGNALPAVSTIDLPVPALSAWEAVEGMLVSVPEALTVSDSFTLARFGELVLSANGRLAQPTNVVAPGAPAIARQNLNDRSRIVLDDANNQQNIDPTRYPAGGLSAANTLRVGDRVNGVTGILEQRFGVYRIQPIAGFPVAIEAKNLRPAPPAELGGTLRVASFNVLNYFNGDGQGGGFPTERGANTPAEFVRQRIKTIAAITAMNADIVGLMELENDAPPNSAIEDLVAGLNETSPGTYAFIDTGIVGTDAIRVALLYKPAVVTPFNSYALMTSAVNPLFIDTKNRPSLAQTFTQLSNGKRLTVVVNHLKSKGSGCEDVGDPDTGDGQGECNVTRTNAATALVQWLASDPTGSGDPDVMLIGDMNSYAKEDPITAMTAAGYIDMIADRIGASSYSYVFQGQSGYLDHGLASSVLAPRVTASPSGTSTPTSRVALDYNVEFKTANQVEHVLRARRVPVVRITTRWSSRST